MLALPNFTGAHSLKTREQVDELRVYCGGVPRAEAIVEEEKEEAGEAEVLEAIVEGEEAAAVDENAATVEVADDEAPPDGEVPPDIEAPPNGLPTAITRRESETDVPVATMDIDEEEQPRLVVVKSSKEYKLYNKQDYEQPWRFVLKTLLYIPLFPILIVFFVFRLLKKCSVKLTKWVERKSKETYKWFWRTMATVKMFILRLLSAVRIGFFRIYKLIKTFVKRSWQAFVHFLNVAIFWPVASAGRWLKNELVENVLSGFVSGVKIALLCFFFVFVLVLMVLMVTLSDATVLENVIDGLFNSTAEPEPVTPDPVTPDPDSVTPDPDSVTPDPVIPDPKNINDTDDTAYKVPWGPILTILGIVFSSIVVVVTIVKSAYLEPARNFTHKRIYEPTQRTIYEPTKRTAIATKDLVVRIITATRDAFVKAAKATMKFINDYIIKPTVNFIIATKDLVVRIITATRDAFVKAAKATMKFINDYIIKPTVNFFIAALTAIKDGIIFLVNSLIINPMKWFCTKLCKFIKWSNKTFWEGSHWVYNSLVTYVSLPMWNLIVSVITKLTEFWWFACESLIALMNYVYDKVATAITTVINIIFEYILDPFFKAAYAAYEFVWEVCAQAFKAAYSAYEFVWEVCAQVFKAAYSAYEFVWEVCAQVFNAIYAAYEAVWGWGENFLNALWELGESIINAAWKAFDSLWYILFPEDDSNEPPGGH